MERPCGTRTCSVSYKFGLVGMAAGALGVPLGSAAAQRLRPRLADADPLVCGFALLASAPLVYFALVAVQRAASLSYLLVFLGMLTLNLTWSIVADVVLVSRLATITSGDLPMRRTSLLMSGCDSNRTNTDRYPHIESMTIDRYPL